MTINIPLTPNRAKKVVFSVSTGRSVGHWRMHGPEVDRRGARCARRWRRREEHGDPQGSHCLRRRR